MLMFLMFIVKEYELPQSTLVGLIPPQYCRLGPVHPVKLTISVAEVLRYVAVTVADVSVVEFGATRSTIAWPFESVTADAGSRVPLVVEKVMTLPDTGLPPSVSVAVMVYRLLPSAAIGPGGE